MSKTDRFDRFTPDERFLIHRALLRLAKATLDHGCEEHLAMAAHIISLADEAGAPLICAYLWTKNETPSENC